MGFPSLIFSHKKLTMNMPNIEHVLYPQYMRNGCREDMVPACRLLKTQWFIFQKMKSIFTKSETSRIPNESRAEPTRYWMNIWLLLLAAWKKEARLGKKSHYPQA